MPSPVVLPPFNNTYYPGCDCCYWGCPSSFFEPVCLGNPYVSQRYAQVWEFEIRGLEGLCAVSMEGFHCLYQVAQGQWGDIYNGGWLLKISYPNCGYELIHTDAVTGKRDAVYRNAGPWVPLGPNVMTLASSDCPGMPATVTLRSKAGSCLDCCDLDPAKTLFASFQTGPDNGIFPWLHCLDGVVVPLHLAGCANRFSGAAGAFCGGESVNVSVILQCFGINGSRWYSVRAFALCTVRNCAASSAGTGDNPTPCLARSCAPFYLDTEDTFPGSYGLVGLDSAPCCLPSVGLARIIITE